MISYAPPSDPDAALLTNAEMGEADRLTIEAGTPSFTLMRRAARHIADVAFDMIAEHEITGRPVSVLCGPGNNGGDGFVAAQILKNRGVNARVYTVGSGVPGSSDCKTAAEFWTGDVSAFSPEALSDAALVVDAILGAGLDRDLSNEFLQVVGAVIGSGLPVLAVDVPTGVDGSTGLVRPRALVADKTVTFFRRKPGHVLFPGRAHCGEVVCCDIGIEASVLEVIRPKAQQVVPELGFLSPDTGTHKYKRGHVGVLSGPAHQTGAARLAARGALRVGAGLVTMVSPPHALQVNAMHLTAIMLARCDSAEDVRRIVSDRRLKTLVMGPGAGVTAETAELVIEGLAQCACVLDADALTAFAAEGPSDTETLFSALKRSSGQNGLSVLTPHEGEFARLFGDVPGDKLARARAAAAQCGAVVVLKGPDTVIAAPDGRASINTTAPPWLASAGSGDVLAGFIGGLIGQGLDGHTAACTGVWLHSVCGSEVGPGLISEDLPEVLPRVFGKLLA